MTDDTTLNIDGNIYWTTKGADAVTFSWDRGAGEAKPSNPAFWAATFAKWKLMTGKDAGSIITDPEQSKFSAKFSAYINCSSLPCSGDFTEAQ